MERVAGIEPARPAWKAGVLPLNYTRLLEIWLRTKLILPSISPTRPRIQMVEGGGFEPPKLSRQIYSLIPLAAREPLQQSIRRVYYPWHFYTGAAF